LLALASALSTLLGAVAPAAADPLLTSPGDESFDPGLLDLANGY